MSTTIIPNKEAKNQALQAALEYLGRGWSVIPLHAVKNGRCTCSRPDCDKPGKHSPVKWKEYQTRRASKEEVIAWWQKWPWANVGIVTGAISGLLVLDIDGPEGAEGVAGRELPPTIIAETGGGGWHYYFFYPEGGNIPNRIALLPHVDIRAEGGYVVAPPSIHRSGRRYTWFAALGETELVPPPAWLVDMLKPQEQARRERETAPSGDLLPCAEAFLERGTVQGTRDICLFTLAKHCRRAGMDQAEALAVLEQANGKCSPPLPSRELQMRVGSAYSGQAGQGYSSLGCDEPAWQGYCVGRDSCPVFHRGFSEEPAEPFPVEALPGPLRRLVEAGVQATGCPAEFFAIPALTVAGGAIGTSRVLRVKKGWEFPANLYTAVVAPTGSGKSPSQEVAVRPLWRLQEGAAKKYEEDMEEYRRELAKWEAECERAKKAKEPKPEKPEEPRMREYVTTNTTTEALGEMLYHNPRGVTLVNDELTAWIFGLNQYKAGQGNDRQTYLSFWSGATAKINRKGKPPLVIPRPFVAVTGAIPPAVLPQLVDESSRGEDGFIHRILFSYPDVELSGWNEREIPEDIIEGYSRLIQSLARLEGNADGTPLVMTLTDEAKTLWAECYNENVTERRRLKFSPLDGVWAKMPSQAARMALIIHCCRLVSGETASGLVDQESMAAGWLLVEYFKAHAKKTYREIRESPLDKKIRRVVAWVREHGRDGVTARDVYRNQVGGIENAENAQKTLEMLVSRKLLLAKETKNTRGRVTKKYYPLL